MSTPETATRKEIEQAVKSWRLHREERLALEREADAMKRVETQFKDFIIAAMDLQKIEAVVVGGRITGIAPKKVWVAEDRVAFLDYVLDNRCPELLQFRLSEPAIREREGEGEQIPGLGTLDVNNIYDRKVK